MSLPIDYCIHDTAHIFQPPSNGCLKCGKSRALVTADHSWCAGVPISVVNPALAERNLKELRTLRHIDPSAQPT